MNEQLRDLMKRAVKAYEEKQKRERSQRFFAWLENTFGITNYEKIRIDENIGAKLENVCFFYSDRANEADGFVTEVIGKCELCSGKCFEIGVIDSIDELGKFVKSDEQENYYFNCGQHLFEYVTGSDLFPKDPTHQPLISAGKELTI